MLAILIGLHDIPEGMAIAVPLINGGLKRRFAIENNVTMFTSLDTVKVLLDVLDEMTIRISTIDA